jgi:hypothetical protein
MEADVGDFGTAMAQKEGHLKRISFINIHIDNVWMKIRRIKIKKKDHTDNLKGYYD